MKRILILSLCLVFSVHSFAQRVRVYESYQFSYAFGDKTALPSFAYLQTLAMGSGYHFRIVSGIKLYQNYAKRPLLPSISTDDNSILALNKTFSHSSINVPLGFEFKVGKFLIGANSDILGFTLNSKTTQATMQKQTYQDLQVSTSSNNFALALKNKGNLNSELYVAIMPQDEFTIRVGMIHSRTQYSTSYTENSETVSGLKYGRQTFIPFVGLVFNFEK